MCYLVYMGSYLTSTRYAEAYKPKPTTQNPNPDPRKPEMRHQVQWQGRMVVLGRMVRCGWLGSGTLQADTDTLQSASSPHSLRKVLEASGLSSRRGASLLLEMSPHVLLQCWCWLHCVGYSFPFHTDIAAMYAFLLTGRGCCCDCWLSQPPQCVFEPIWNHCRDGVGAIGMLRAGRRSVGRSASLEVLEAGTKTDETAVGA